MEHNLNIISLHDAQAECRGCGWSFTRTGPAEVGEIQEEFKKHLSTQRVLFCVDGFDCEHVHRGGDYIACWATGKEEVLAGFGVKMPVERCPRPSCRKPK